MQVVRSLQGLLRHHPVMSAGEGREEELKGSGVPPAPPVGSIWTDRFTSTRSVPQYSVTIQTSDSITLLEKYAVRPSRVSRGGPIRSHSVEYTRRVSRVTRSTV